ncbi:extracellular solute-binding protein [Cohaesibacter sp. CAU 1516]|uniref:extracellular solute-binding protein n=1 Tax=Cohaesibacter sp. CAU 1516 TaxID=2576038 RepID=UPI0014857784|nr:extracellular solute-binding protein [Cohaesibacter sp. CAU 1516]
MPKGIAPTQPLTPPLTRRAFLQSSATAALTLGTVALAMRPLVGFASVERHGLSVFGELKYPPGFAQFGYVNATAPKGGRFSFSAPSWLYNQNPQTFNTLNGFVLKGDAPPRIELLFDMLMVRAHDEPDAVYCHLAQSVALSPDGNHLSFRLRPEARFHDGSKVTPDDVAFSYLAIKEKGHPNLKLALRALDMVDVADDMVTLVFDGTQSRQDPLEAASTIPIFSKADFDGKAFDASSLTPPVGSGPYKIGLINAGSVIEFHRDRDYWGKDLPTAVGHNNFDIIRLSFSRDSTTTFESFKKGDLNFWLEFSSKRWATQYDFPAIHDGRVKKLELPDDQPSAAQGWFFNTRRSKFADPRTREAIATTFDFEWSNEKLFFGLYQRTQSFFERTKMKASGKAEGKVLALLEPFRDQLDPAVFDEPYTPPVSDSSGRDRKLLARSIQLLKEAGWTQTEVGWVNGSGETLEIELLGNTPLFERIINPWAERLALIGVPLRFRLVDPAQFQRRLDEFDFDLAGRRYSMSATLGPATRSVWGSASAETNGSYNLAGLKLAAMDAMIDAALAAESREDMEAAGQAIDRIWRAGHYWIPNWNKPVHTIGLWQGIQAGETAGLYEFYPESWWWMKG